MAPVVVVLSRHTPSGYQAGIDERSGLDEGLGYYVAGVVGNERASDHLCNFQPIIFHYIKGWANLLAWLRTYNSIAEFSESPAKSEPIGSGNIRNRIDTTCNHVEHRLQDPLGIPGNYLLPSLCGGYDERLRSPWIHFDRFNRGMDRSGLGRLSISKSRHQPDVDLSFCIAQHHAFQFGSKRYSVSAFFSLLRISLGGCYNDYLNLSMVS